MWSIAGIAGAKDDSPNGPTVISGCWVGAVNSSTSGSEQVDTITIVNQHDQRVSYKLTADSTYYGHQIADIHVGYKGDGKLRLYIIPKDTSSIALPIGDIISFSLTNDGKIADIYMGDYMLFKAGSDIIDANHHAVMYNGILYPAAEAIIFNYHPADGKIDVLRWEDVEQATFHADFFYIDKTTQTVKFLTMYDQAVEEHYSSWCPTTSTSNIALDKEWKIRFSQPVDAASLAEHITVIAESGTSVSVCPHIWEADSTGQTVIVSHDGQPFAPGTAYKLYISRHVMPMYNSTSLANGWSLAFTTAP
jgi:hypothetical protein